MNKTYLKSYYAQMGKHNQNKQRLENKCFKMENNYLISDSYSIICLNDSYNLEVSDDKLKESVINLYSSFKNNYIFKNNITLSDDKFTKIDDLYSIGNKKAKTIIKIIKADKISILEPKEQLYYFSKNPMIYLENTKTKEHAYLLPCSTY